MINTYKNILKEIKIISAKTHKLHGESQMAKQKALLEYRKIQLIKAKKPIDEINKEIGNLNNDAKPSDKFEKLFKGFFEEANSKDVSSDHEKLINESNFRNIYTFLSSQRTYQELLERYNPGINFDQTENVSKSANRVGLKVPE